MISPRGRRSRERCFCMDFSELREQIEKQALIALGGEDLLLLLEASETIREEDTCLAGSIRILSLDGRVLVQEETPDGEILVHRLGSREAAERFVADRLATYDRMWDGCGCRIDYHQQSEDE